MNKQAQQLIKRGAQGSFLWINVNYPENEPEQKKVTRTTFGKFTIKEVRSKDFIIEATLDDGRIKPRVYCEIPANKKDSETDFLADRFTQRTKETRHGIVYIFARTMVFNS
jgi:hypothetical protein